MPKIMPFDIDITQTPTYKEGKLEGKLEVAKAIIILGKNTPQEIVSLTGLTLEQIKALQAEMDKKKK